MATRPSARRPAAKQKVNPLAALKNSRSLARLGSMRSAKFAIKGLFKYGYRNKEDVSNLPPETLIIGSQNVLTNAAEQVGIREGYQLDGPAGTTGIGIDSSFDFNTHSNGIQNTRKTDTNLQVRYENPVSGAITWITMLSTLIADNKVRFTTFWDSVTELKNLCLFVNGDENVYEWTGGVASFLSATTTTLTVSGTKTLGQLNFYQQSANNSKKKFLMNGTEYTYSAAGYAPTNAISHNDTTAEVDIGGTYISQLFTTGANGQTIFSATARVKNDFGADIHPEMFTGAIYSDSGGQPGTLLTSKVLWTPTVTSGGTADLTFDFNLSVLPATNYHFVLVGNFGVNVFNAYIGATPAVGTFTGSPGLWTPSNGYLYLTVVENDASQFQFTGVVPDPSASGAAVGDAVIQTPQIGATGNPGNPNFPSRIDFDLIGNLNNHIFYGSETFNTVYVSKDTNYANCSFSSPRLPGEGASAVLDAPPIGFVNQQGALYISAGFGFWYTTIFTLSSDLTKESFSVERLETAPRQGAQSQELIGNMKNQIAFVSNEPIVNLFGLVPNIFGGSHGTPQMVNISDPIKNDVDAYDFTDGEVEYDNYFFYITVPAEGVVRLFNVVKEYWEAPQTIPISRFYRVDGVLYGHSKDTDESYQLFTGYNDNGFPIKAVAAFPYVSQEGGQASEKKVFTELYAEGYMSENTTITATINYDFGGTTASGQSLIQGSDQAIMYNAITDGSLGQNPLGSEPIGSILNIPQPSLNPKFRVIKRFVPKNFFDYQVVFSSYDVDFQWTLLRFGLAIRGAEELPTNITE